MEQQSIEKMLLSLQEEVKSLKFLNGGALSDLVTRVYNLEQRRPCYPDFSKLLFSELRGLETYGTPIIPNWSESNPSDTIVLPYDGYLVVSLHTENQDINEKYSSNSIYLYLNNRTFCSSDSTTSMENHTEDSNSNSCLVQAGDVCVIRGTKNPNAQYNYMNLSLYGLKF